MYRRPKYSDSGAQNRGPKQYPNKNSVITNPAASDDTWKCAAMPFGPSNAPEGLEDANVAFTTSRTEQTVIYHLLPIDQFFGFSISSGAKSRCPSSFRWGSSSGMPFVR